MRSVAVLLCLAAAVLLLLGCEESDTGSSMTTTAYEVGAEGGSTPATTGTRGDLNSEATAWEPTQEQLDIEASLGAPDQFTIAYVAAEDEDGEPVARRMEVWYYHTLGQSIAFIEGRFSSVATIGSGGEDWAYLYPDLSPHDFDITLGYEDVSRLLAAPVQVVDYLPEEAETEEMRVYLSEEALFVVERGVLTYFQTVGVSR